MQNYNSTQVEMFAPEAIAAIVTHLNLIEGVDFFYPSNHNQMKYNGCAVMYAGETMLKMADWIIQHGYPEEVVNLETGQICHVKYKDKQHLDSIAPCMKNRMVDTSIMLLEPNKRYGHGYQIRRIRNGVTKSIMNEMPIKIGEAAIGLALAIDSANSMEGSKDSPSDTIFVARDAIIANFKEEFGDLGLISEIESGECTEFSMSINGRLINIAIV